jgi:cell wall-associated NlpC family hydrolase
LTYAVPAEAARLPHSTWATSFRRFVLIFTALALALTLLALDAPAADARRGDGSGSRSEAQRVIRFARTHLGARFRIGTEGMRYFDCSGFVYRVFKQAGLLNRIGGSRKRAAGYYSWFRKRGLVSRNNPRPGDLMIWTKKGHIAHIGIAINSGRAISALTSGVRTHRHRSLDTKFKAYLHVRLNR